MAYCLKVKLCEQIIYFTGMEKTLYWWWIITADIGKLRNYIYRTDLATTITKIYNGFLRIGEPEIVKSDNGPQYNPR